ncbi:ankyrin repeat-containing domain protein [Nemania sp. NC0429]|nr:ankyrin repeat-containing domain protein [Nemania sp. NC0429]
MAYKYEADLSINNLLSEWILHRAAISLLEAVAEKRKGKDNGPIIFLCHNIGGVLVKKVLFGTPDTSSQWEDVVFNIVLATANPSQRIKAVGVAAKTGTEALHSASLAFDSLNSQYHIITAAGDSETPFIGIAAPRDVSPVTPGPKRVIVDYPRTDHQDLCKSPPQQFVRKLGDQICGILSKDGESLLPFLKFRQAFAASSSVPTLVSYSAPEPAPGTLDWADEILKDSAGLIAIYGAPGTGKSVLASWLARQRLKQAEAVTLWYYFSVSDYRRRTYHQFLHSCILQLLYPSRGLFESSYLRKITNQLSWNKPPSCAELHRLLQAIIWKMSDTTIYFIVDAVNECDTSSTQLLYDMGRLAKSNSNCRIIMTSRPEDHIMSVFSQFGAKNIELDRIMDKEGPLYLAKQVENAALADYKEPLMAVGTTMLHITLLVELVALVRPYEGHLLELSTLKTYHETYEQIIKQIRAHSSLIQEVLLCVGFAERPLSLDELYTALLRRPPATSYLTKVLANDLITTLKPLLRIQDNTFYLIHDSLRGFIGSQLESLLRSTISTHPSNAALPASPLLLKCWEYLREDCLQEGKVIEAKSEHSAQVTATRTYPGSGLILYIVQCWSLHLKQMVSDEDHTSLIFWSFWNNEVIRRKWIEAWANCQPTRLQKPPPNVFASAFAFGAFFGISAIVFSLAEKGDFGYSSLEEGIKLALGAGHHYIVKALLPNMKSRELWKYIVEVCCGSGYVQLLEWSLKAHELAEFTLSQSELRENLAIATREGHSLIIRCLVESGAKLNTAIEREEFLTMAIESGFEGALSELIASEAKWMLDTNSSKETDGNISEPMSLLHMAAQSGSAAVVKVVASETDVNAKGGWKAPVLHSTAQHDYAEAAEALLDRGALIDADDDMGYTALLLACAHGSENVIRVLLDRGANVDRGMRLAPKLKPLQLAANHGRSNVTRLLLDGGAYRGASDKQLGTALHIAIENMVEESQQTYYDVVELLLKYNASVNEQRLADGATPLHLAIKNDKADMGRVIKLLMRDRADADKTNHDNKSPLFYALRSKHKHAELLWNTGASWDETPKAAVSVLMDAVAKGMYSRVLMLLEAGCDPEEQDIFGRTARDVALKANIRGLLAPTHANAVDNNDEGTMCAFVNQDVQAERDFRQISASLCYVCHKETDTGPFYRKTFFLLNLAVD